VDGKIQQLELPFDEPKEKMQSSSEDSSFTIPKDWFKCALKTPFAKGVFALAVAGIVFMAGLVAVIYLFSTGLQVVAGGIRLIIEILMNHPILTVVLLAIIGGLWIGIPQKIMEQPPTNESVEQPDTKDEEIF
jgi:hypothetical protein